MRPVVTDARPPIALVRMLNVIMRVVLRTPAGRLMRPLALIEFEGRRSGHRYRVPVGWHHVRQDEMVFTPAAWRSNFSGGGPVRVYHRGRSRSMWGTLVLDPVVVARSLRALLEGGAPPRLVGLRIDEGHEITPAEVASLGRAVIRFEQVATGTHAPAQANGAGDTDASPRGGCAPRSGPPARGR